MVTSTSELTVSVSSTPAVPTLRSWPFYLISDRLKPAFLDADFGLQQESNFQLPSRLSETPPLPPSTPSKDAQDAHSRTPTQLRIVGRSRSGRVIRLPAKLHTVVTGATGGSPVAA